MTTNPDRAASPRALILTLAAAGFASTFAGRISDPMVPVIAADLGSAPETIALIATAFTLPYAVIQPVLGPFGDALGKFRIMGICLAVLAASLAASAFATSPESLFALRVVSGAAAGGVIPLALATLGDRIPLERRQVAISRFLVAVILGQLSGSVLGGLLVAAIDWRGVFALSAALAVGGWAVGVVGASRNVEMRQAFSVSVALARYRSLLADPKARSLFSFVFVESIALFGIFPYLAGLLEANRAGGPREAGISLAFFAIGGLLFSALVSAMLRFLGLRWMLVGGGAICAAGLLLIGVAHDWRVYALAKLGMGLGFYMLHNSFQVQVTELNPQARGSAVALHACSFFLGAAVAPIVTGFGLAWLGRGPTMVVAAALALGLGIASARILTRR